MRNVNNGYALLTEQFHYFEHVLNFVVCQRCARLIHNQHFGILLNGLGNFDHLLVAHGKVFYKFARIDFDLKLVKCLCSFLLHRPPVDHDTVTDRTAEEQVFSRRQFTDVVEFLVDNCNSVFSCKLRSHAVKFFAVDFDLSACRDNGPGTALNQSGLSRSVFSDQSEDFTGPELKGDVLQCDNARIFFSDMFQFKDILFTHMLPPDLFSF